MHSQPQSLVGITSYGHAIPHFRITVDEIAQAHGSDGSRIERSLGLQEKTVPGRDQDTITLAVDAGRHAHQRLPEKHEMEAIYVGSESHPYAVKPTATFVGHVINQAAAWTAADTEFACKAGTAALQMVIGLVESGRINHGLAIGVDTAQGSPGDTLEYSAAAGAAAFTVGKEKVIARLLHTTSFTSETPDFWRREHQTFPQHSGRFTGEPAYFYHVQGATQQLFHESGMKAEDFDHVVLHMPNGKFPRQAAGRLGLTHKQLQAGFVVPELGNTYSACSLLGLCSVLDQARSGEKVLLTSYGSGAGSDSFAFEMTEEIDDFRGRIKQDPLDQYMQQQLQYKSYLTYGQYTRHSGKLVS